MIANAPFTFTSVKIVLPAAPLQLNAPLVVTLLFASTPPEVKVSGLALSSTRFPAPFTVVFVSVSGVPVKFTVPASVCVVPPLIVTAPPPVNALPVKLLLLVMFSAWPAATLKLPVCAPVATSASVPVPACTSTSPALLKFSGAPAG